MKKEVLVLVLIFSFFSLAYTPAVYIANQETLECKYYFAGDENHVNPQPEGFDVVIGLSENFEDVDDACNQWKCFISKGSWDGKCDCTGGMRWDDDGCVQTKGGELFTLDRILMLAIIAFLIVYIINKRRR